MNFPKQTIQEIAIKVFNDLGIEYYSEREPLIKFWEHYDYFPEELGKNYGWKAVFEWFDPDYLDGMDSVVGITIDDDTGIPISISHRWGAGPFLIKKDASGKYVFADE